MTISDISGVYCPMGCGETLHLMSGGMIKCLKPGCPEPGAVQMILGNNVTDDIIEFSMDGQWAIIHPLRERLTGLLNCAVHAMAAGLIPPPDLKAGRYLARAYQDRLELVAMDLSDITITLMDPVAEASADG